MSVALKDNIQTLFKGESHDDDATCLFYLPAQLALTGTAAALLTALPVSIELGRSSATDPDATGVRLKIDTAEPIVGRPATPRSAAGVARRTTRRTVRRRVY
jgi:hypothetical protein